MSLAEYAAMDVQWYLEAKTAIEAYRNGLAARKEADAHQARLRAG